MAQLELHDRRHLQQLTTSATWSLAIAVSLIPIILVVLFYVTSARHGSGAIDWAAEGRRLTDDPRMWLLLIGVVLTPFAFLYERRARRYERLILTETGMRYVSPLPQFKPGWSIQWSQVRALKFRTVAVRERTEIWLTVETVSGTQQVQPDRWVDPDFNQPMDASALWAYARRKFEQAAADTMRSPMIRFIQKIPGLALQPPVADRPASDPLLKNPAAIATAACFVVLVFYALVDNSLLFETYADAPPYAAYGLGGLALAAAILLLLQRVNVPRVERWFVALATGIAFGAALYPGLLRINMLTDHDGLVSYEYKMAEPGHFVPTTTQLPELSFPERHEEFWSTHQAGHIETFRLRRGGLGFYQINMLPILDRVRDHYRDRR